MSDLLNLTKQELQKLQFDVLWSSIKNNGYLPDSQVAVLNKNLKTDSKIIIKAINEVLTKADSAQEAFRQFEGRFNTVLGDTISNPNLLDELNNIGGNLIHAVFVMKQDFFALTGEGGLPDLKDTVDHLMEQVNEVSRLADELLSKTTIIAETARFVDRNSFEVTYPPLDNENLEFYINGIKYNKSDFIFADDSNLIVFKFTADHGGFDLQEDFEIIVRYNYAH